MNFVVKNVKVFFYAFLILFLLISSSLKSELLILKRIASGDFEAVGDSDPNKDSIYEILLKYQWPMCTANLDKLSDDEKKELFPIIKIKACEERFIQKKIQKKYSNGYHVAFVPTAIYELFCLSDEMIFNETKEGATGIGSITRTLIDAPNKYGDDTSSYESASDGGESDVTSQPQNVISQTKDEIMQQFININQAEGTKSCFFHINEKLWKYLKQQNPDITPEKTADLFIDNDEIKKIINDLISRAVALNDSEREEYCKNFSGTQIDQYSEIYGGICGAKSNIRGLLNPSTEPLLAIIAEQESKARNECNALLYRSIGEHKALGISKTSERAVSTNPALDEPLTLAKNGGGSLEEKIRASNFESRSLSYGNSILNGVLKDSGSGPFCYFANDYERGYILLLDKRDFAFGDLAKLFFISPLITCAALFTSGALSHSRSKVVGKSPDSPLIKGIYDGCYDKSGLIYEQGNALLHSAKLLRYISNNSKVLVKQWISVQQAVQLGGTAESANLLSAISAVEKWKKFSKDSKIKKLKNELLSLKTSLGTLKTKLGTLGTKLTALQKQLKAKA